MRMLTKEKRKIFLVDTLPMILAGAGILFFSILNHQHPVKTLPTLISLAVMLLAARANRYSYLLGAMNVLLYTVGYFMEGLVFSIVSAILISFPMQLWTFFNWKRHTSGSRVCFRRLNARQWALALGGLGMLWGGCMLFLRPLFASAAHPGLDALMFVIDIVSTLLTALVFVESQYIKSAGTLVYLVMWTSIVMKNPENMNYLIIGFYNVWRVFQCAIVWTKQAKTGKMTA